MDFWMEDDEVPSQEKNITNTQNAAKAKKTKTTNKSTSDDPQVTCQNCGGTDFYYDEDTGADVCSFCFTQSQQLSQRRGDLDDSEFINHAARVKGKLKSSFRARAKGGSGGLMGSDLTKFDKSQPLPNLSECLTGLKIVLKKSIDILLLDLLQWKDEQRRQQVHQTAKHLFLSYVTSWGQGAEHYGTIYPQLRFSFRDLFLPHVYRRAVHSVHLQEALQQAQQADYSDEEDDDDGIGKMLEKLKGNPESMSRWQDAAFPPEPDTVGSATPTRLPETPASPPEGSSESLPYHEFIQLAVERAGPKAKGHMEAALVLEPSMDLVASILWLSVARGGVAPYTIVNWIWNGELPLQHAFTLLLNKGLQHKLRPVRRVFGMSKLVSTHVLEHTGSLLLIAARVKSFAAFCGRDKELPRRPGKLLRQLKKAGLVQTLSVAAIPVTASQLVADSGLGQNVLDTALALMGVGKTPGKPYHRRLGHVTVKDIYSMSHLSAVIMCAVELQPYWRSWTIARLPSSRENATTLDAVKKNHRVVPWITDHFRLVTNDSFSSYLQFCEERFSICPHKTKVSVLHDSLFSDDPDSMGGPQTNNVQEMDSVRPCTLVAGVPLPGLEVEEVAPLSLLQQRILYLVETSKRRIIDLQSTRAALPYLDSQEALLLEFLAYTSCIPSVKIRRALAELLGFATP